jgi:thioredoxin reductase (NADPH)
MSVEHYDLLIAGGGPAGLTAALYGQRLGLRTVVCGDIPGGSMYMIENLSNFPGLPSGSTGTELGLKIFQQAQAEGARFTMSRLKKLHIFDNAFKGLDENDQTFTAPAGILATGRSPIELPLQKKPLKGVNFCSICDGPLYRNQNASLAVIGSDNIAAQHALTLSRVADKVLLIHRSIEARMDRTHAALLSGRNNIFIKGETEVLAYKGLERIEALAVRSGKGESYEIPIDGVFPAIGWRANIDVLDFPVDTSADGYLETDQGLMTSVPGLFAAGDVRNTDLRQVLTACADGARAAVCAAAYLSRNHAEGSRESD